MVNELNDKSQDLSIAVNADKATEKMEIGKKKDELNTAVLTILFR